MESKEPNPLRVVRGNRRPMFLWALAMLACSAPAIVAHRRPEPLPMAVFLGLVALLALASFLRPKRRPKLQLVTNDAQGSEKERAA